jgi:aryl-phospho-beta-D-glucosidase BglC (GH1 family)
MHSVSIAQLPLLQTEQSFIVKADTKEKIVLKGIAVSNNVWGFYEWPVSDSLEKAGKDIFIRPRIMKDFIFTEQDVENIGSLGGNTVRYSFNYELFEEKNPSRPQNLQTLRKHIGQLEKKGLYTIVHLHLGPGLDVVNDNYERDHPGDKRMQSVLESDSLFVLWRNVWQKLAADLADLNSVAGYELINEPRRPASADASEADLVKKYVEVVDSIRAADEKHIIMICEFNSREAEPGETYWSNTQKHYVTDKGEQGVIWGRNWIKLPAVIPNLVYVAHLYNPYEFTLGKTSDSYDGYAVRNAVKEAVEWACEENNRPLLVSEYGVSYVHTLKGNDEVRTRYLKMLHDEFDRYHISSTYFQYKDLITPWVDMGAALGLWMHFYDQSTIAGIENNHVVYAREDAEQAAYKFNVDDILNKYFIRDGALESISPVGNEGVINELKRYFRNETLNLMKRKRSEPSGFYLKEDFLIIHGLGKSAHTELEVYSVMGQLLLKTSAAVSDEIAYADISELKKKTSGWQL